MSKMLGHKKYTLPISNFTAELAIRVFPAKNHKSDIPRIFAHKKFQQK